jgi:primosomal protein N' (replication factor Y) (superfamily II helicase)
MHVEVAVPLPILRTFTYSVPPDLRDRAVPGSRVLVPFTRGERVAWIDRVVAASETRGEPRAILAVLDAEPSLPPAVLELSRWAAEYYVAPLGQVVKAAVPAVLSGSSSDSIELVDGAGDLDELTDLEAVLVDWLRASGPGPHPVARLRRETADRAWWPVIRRLEERGILRVRSELPRTEPAVRTRRVLRLTRELPSLRERDEIFGRARRQRECWEWVETVGGSIEVTQLVGQHNFSYPVIRALVDRELATVEEEVVPRDPYALIEPGTEARHDPTPAQAAAIGRLIQAGRSAEPGTFLVRGVTGSGKTLVYVELLRDVVERQGRSAIVLVPEIALTPQTVGRFRAVFGDRVAVLHSALSDGERYDEWRALRSGEKRIAVGARSAVFAPLFDVGAIIVDEEHEATYKQAEAPRYHARELAIVRAGLERAVCVLGSATPALESWVNATAGKYGLIELPERVGGQPMPAVRVVDLREERRAVRERSGTSESVVLSTALREAVKTRLERGEQSILLLNRRGYANFVQCRDCGHVWDCPSCAVSLTFHRRRARLTCHYCLYEEDTPETCVRCSSTELSFRGVGTEQVERTVEEAFPAASIARMDVDTTAQKWAHHRILDKVGSGEIDILLGTQMIAKGLDFPNVTLVGVINADVGINLPDFRATERTFQLVTQVAGRAGRGPKGGEVLIQTSLPTHYAITCSLEHDFIRFAELELEARRSPLYPPFCKLVNVVVSGLDEAGTQQATEAATQWIQGLIGARGLADVEVVGPAPCPIEKIRDRWRWHFLLRSRNASAIGRVSRYFGERFRLPSGRHDLRIAIDRDPVALL